VIIRISRITFSMQFLIITQERRIYFTLFLLFFIISKTVCSETTLANFKAHELFVRVEKTCQERRVPKLAYLKRRFLLNIQLNSPSYRAAGKGERNRRSKVSNDSSSGFLLHQSITEKLFSGTNIRSKFILMDLFNYLFMEL
jgi:hypothetical protein